MNRAALQRPPGMRVTFTVDRRHVLAGLAAAFLVLLIVAVVASYGGSSHTRRNSESRLSNAPAALSPVQPQLWTAVPPLTDVPAQTPVQQQYDAALASGLAASSSIQAAEVAQIPPPGFTADWPALPVANTPEQWVAQFTQDLLNIDFARQTRAGLGQWLSAEEAPELLAGVPASIADKVLYLSLFDTAAVGGTSSPVPDASSWASAAQTGERWSVSDLVIQADPQFSQIVASGWEPIDQRFAVEDVTGLLIIHQGQSDTTHHFSMEVYVGSAHWHNGYGTVLVNNWKES